MLFAVAKKSGMALSQNSSRVVERVSVFVFLAATLLIPLITVELYPFSAASMFAHAPTSYTIYQVADGSGKRLNYGGFGIDLKNPHDPPVRTLGREGYGRRYPPSPAGFDVDWNEALVRQRVERELETLRHKHVNVLGARFEIVDGKVQCLDFKHYQVDRQRPDR
jgi:hypothetical protein